MSAYPCKRNSTGSGRGSGVRSGPITQGLEEGVPAQISTRRLKRCEVRLGRFRRRSGRFAVEPATALGTLDLTTGESHRLENPLVRASGFW